MSISFIKPKPPQTSHAPCGELNEKICGAGSLYEIPVVGHMKFLL